MKYFLITKKYQNIRLFSWWFNYLCLYKH